MRICIAFLISVLWCAASAAAQSPAEIRLTSIAGDFSISGKLIAIESDTYILATSVGTFRIATDAVHCEGAACPTAATVEIYVNATLGQQVALTGSTLMIAGTLKAFEGQSYTVETKVGDITVPAMEVTCTGSGCPVARTVPAAHLPTGFRPGS